MEQMTIHRVEEPAKSNHLPGVLQPPMEGPPCLFEPSGGINGWSIQGRLCGKLELLRSEMSIFWAFCRQTSPVWPAACSTAIP